MPAHKKFNPDFYLNRIALEEKIDPYTVDPYAIIQTFFEYDDVAGIIEVFRMCCQSALSDKYSWKEGTPGNLVYFHERLELLVEACYLLYINKKNRQAKINGTEISKTLLKEIKLPCLLSSDELNNPFLVIEQFFALYELNKWKCFIHCWMEAGLSNYTVTDNINQGKLLPYCRNMEKLMEATYWILFHLKHKEKKK